MYYTDVSYLTAEDYKAAGSKAAKEHDDDWFACDVATSQGATETGTVFTEHNGIKYEVWLERTWAKAKAAESR